VFGINYGVACVSVTCLRGEVSVLSSSVNVSFRCKEQCATILSKRALKVPLRIEKFILDITVFN
jgi:hypothetical protein